MIAEKKIQSTPQDIAAWLGQLYIAGGMDLTVMSILGRNRVPTDQLKALADAS